MTRSDLSIYDLAPGQRWLDKYGAVWTVTDDMHMWATSPDSAIHPGIVFADCQPLKLLQEVDAPEPDMVNHPAHYNRHPSGVECITIVQHMGFCLGNVVKYVWRADEKGDAIEDLEKAAFYLQVEIARRKAAQ